MIRHRPAGLRKAAASLTAALCLTLAACTPSSPPEPTPSGETAQSEEAPAPQSEPADGPRAPADRPLAERSISENEAGTARRISIDFGNTTDGAYSAPKRGTLVIPTQGEGASNIVILSHLRAPNCEDRSFAYPCAYGVNEFRYDDGMLYLADHLAENGYTVVVPDLGGIYVGGDLQSPYSQTAMWEDVVSTFLDSLRTDLSGATSVFGTDFARPANFENVGLFAHSRSGQIIESAMRVVGERNLKGVFAYGPAYDTVELEHVSLPLPDVPYLAVVGSLDSDVGPSANLLLGHYAALNRQTVASVAEVPGLGHMYVNRAASAANFDDRIGCDVITCPDAAAHESVLNTVALDWFNATLGGADTTLPMHQGSALPAQVAGLPAHWLSITPSPSLTLEASAFHEVNDGTITQCTITDGMTPSQQDQACPEPEAGVVQILTPVAYVEGGATVMVEAQPARGMDIQIAPAGTFEGSAGTSVEVVLALAGGDVHRVTIPADHPALASRKNDIDDGTYRLGTVRIPLDDMRENALIRQVMIASESHPFFLRSVSFW